MKNNFVEKLYKKYGGKTIARPFSTKWKLSVFLDYSLKFYTVCFYCMPSRGLSTYVADHFGFNRYKAF